MFVKDQTLTHDHNTAHVLSHVLSVFIQKTKKIIHKSLWMYDVMFPFRDARSILA